MIRVKNLIYSIVLTSAISIVSPLEATDYYACDCQSGADAQCQSGSDSNSGTSPNSPWQTYDRAQDQFVSLQGGDSIQFCQGGFFPASGDNHWINNNALANNRVTIRDYTPPWGSGDEGRPIIEHLTNTAFSFDASGHQEGVNILNLELRGGGTGRGIFLPSDIDDVLMDNLVIDGFSSAVYAPGADNENQRITLRNSTIINNGGQGWQGGGSGYVVENNYFENNGFYEANYNHNIYFSGNGADGAIIRGNTSYRSTMVNGECAGAPLVVHGNIANLIIEDNVIREDIGAVGGGCWGIAVDPGYTAVEHFDNLIIRRNTVINAGGLGIGCQACTNAIIENNVVIAENTGLNEEGEPNSFTGIRVPNRLNSSAEDTVTSNVMVRNNSIYFGATSRGRGIRIQREGTGYSVLNNAVYYAGTASSWACFDFDLSRLPLSAFDEIDNNLCYYPNSSGDWENGTGDLAAWRSATTFGDNSINADPLFNSPSNHDLSIPSNSPVINAGHPTESASEDFAGNPRVGVADIGAFESGSNPPPTSGTRYWVGGNGNWSDGNNWADTSGGAGGAGAPGSGDDAIFDNNSGASTITLDQNVNVRDIHVSSASGSSASSNLTINLNGRTLSASRDAIFGTGRIDQGSFGSILSVGRNLDTSRCDTTTREGNMSVHMVGTGYWRYTLGLDPDSSHLDNPIIWNFLAAQNNQTTTLRLRGEGRNGVDIDVNNQLIMGNGTGLLTMDLAETTGDQIVTIEIQNNSDTLDIVSSGARYAITKIEHEPPNGGQGQLQSNVVFQNLDTYDITGNFGLPSTSTPTWTLTGDMNLGGATYSIEKSAILDMNGHDLQVGSINIGGGSTGTGQLLVGSGALTVANELRIGSDIDRPGRLHLNSGYVSAESLRADDGINFITGDNNGVLELTGSAPGTSDVFYVAENGNDSNPGTSQGAPIRTFEHALTKLQNNSDQILFRRGDQFTIPDELSINLAGGTMGAYGSGPRPIIFMSQPGTIYLTGDAWTIYDLRIEFGDQTANAQPSANVGQNQVLQLVGGQTSIAVALDGSASVDPDGSIVAYRWSGNPDPSDVAQPIVNLTQGVYIFTLEVEDNEGATDSAQVTITVESETADPPSPPQPPPPNPDPDPDPNPDPQPDPVGTTDDFSEKFVNSLNEGNNYTTTIPCDSQIEIYSNMGTFVESIECVDGIAVLNAVDYSSGIYLIRRNGQELTRLAVLQ